MGSHALPIRSSPFSRSLVLLAAGLLTLVMFGPCLKSVISLGVQNDRYLQIVVAPLACGFLLAVRRDQIFMRATYSPRAGIPLMSGAMALGTLAVSMQPAGENSLPAVIAMILMWMAAFVWCCGVGTFCTGIYPLCCLFLMIPFPAAWMDRAATFLQNGSAAAAFRILRLTGIPVFRNGMLFSLPGLDFEVGTECSGIHSSLALIMIAVVAGYLCLRSWWGRMALIVLTIPIAVLKNAIRIAVITILGARVNRVFFDGPFHYRYGGVVFSIVGVVLFVAVLTGLQMVERDFAAKRR